MTPAATCPGVSRAIERLPSAEQHLIRCDSRLAYVVACQTLRWPCRPTEDLLWGLIRVVMAQQVSTLIACRVATRAKALYPQLASPSPAYKLQAECLRDLGLSQRRAECCVEIVRRSDQILTKVERGISWEEALNGIKGIGPWTISVFRIMVLRDPDVLPLGDVGLERAIRNVYGRARNVERLGESWRPFRSVACWYLWRTLGNEQLG